ncbi:MAG: hypothetical protein R6T98_13880 [Desulfatiglandales bacterium]
MTCGLRLAEPAARRKGCCLFTTCQWGETAGPDKSGSQGHC